MYSPNELSPAEYETSSEKVLDPGTVPENHPVPVPVSGRTWTGRR